MEGENQLPVPHQQQALSEVYNLDERVKLIAKAIVDINQIVAYPMTAIGILEWAGTINRLMPGIDVGALAFLMDCFLTEKIVWDKNKGIQNILGSIGRVVKSNVGYEIKREYSW